MNELSNAPQVKLAIIGVSRDCFPAELTAKRLASLASACQKKQLNAYVCKTIIENENDTMAALAEADEAGANAAVIYLGNFGPEGPLAIFAEEFPGPVMACAAAEESANNLIDGRGDALCGLLNASYNFNLRSLNVYIPPAPVGSAEELAEAIAYFENLARILLAVSGLKIFTFGPRPHDFYACNAPIKPAYDLGVEVMENSELDLLQLYQAVDAGDKDVKRTAKQMADELGDGNTYPDLLEKLARFEVALERFVSENLGSRHYAAMANKCWPAFEKAFGFVPCYVNSRLTSRGIPVACEVDIYGAISEYMCYLASQSPATLLDVNNSVPADTVEKKTDLKGAELKDLFMGFHCGNTPSCHMKNCSLKYQLIMNRLMEDASKEPDITRGTLEGQIAAGPITLFRLQGTADCELDSYLAEGHVLDVDPQSFGAIGVFAVPNFARFYRHVMLARHFPHHSAVAFSHCGRILYDAVQMMGLEDINIPLPPTELYYDENPFGAK